MVKTLLLKQWLKYKSTLLTDYDGFVFTNDLILSVDIRCQLFVVYLYWLV